MGFNDAQSLFQLHARKVGGARTQCATCGSANSTIRQLRASEQRQHHRRARRIGEGTKRRGCGDGERGAAAWKKRRIALVGGRAMHTCERALRPVKRGNGVVLGQVMETASFSSVWAAGRGLLTGRTQSEAKKKVGCCLGRVVAWNSQFAKVWRSYPATKAVDRMSRVLTWHIGFTIRIAVAVFGLGPSALTPCRKSSSLDMLMAKW